MVTIKEIITKAAGASIRENAAALLLKLVAPLRSVCPAIQDKPVLARTVYRAINGPVAKSEFRTTAYAV